MTTNIAASRFGRSLVAIRDAEVAAEAVGISKPALLVTVFLFSGAVAGIAGGLFASLQSYITPDAFTFDLSVLFFIAILIGGRGSILGPLLGTIILTVLPEFAAPLVAWSTFLYAVLLLVDRAARCRAASPSCSISRTAGRSSSNREIVPRPELLRAPARRRTREPGLLDARSSRAELRRRARHRRPRPRDPPGEVHGLIGPNGSGKTTTLNVISGYYAPQQRHVRLNGERSTARARTRARACASRARSRPRGSSARPPCWKTS